jgi:hypothetical protein
MRPVSGFLAVAWGVASITRGTPLQPGHVAADAAWVVHLDVESLARSPLGDRLRQRASTPPLDLPLDSLASSWGFDPRMDLTGLTAYGSRMDAGDAVCLVYGRFSPVAAIGVPEIFPLRLRGASGPSASGATVYGLIVDTNLFVAGRTPKPIRGARAVIEGRASARAPTTTRAGSDRPAIFSAWLTNAAPETLPARAAIFQRTSRLDLHFSVNGQWLEGWLSLGAADAGSAEEMRQVVAGMAGALLLKADPGSDRETVLRRVRVSRDDADVRIEVRIPLDLAEHYLVALLGEAAAELSPPP